MRECPLKAYPFSVREPPPIGVAVLDRGRIQSLSREENILGILPVSGLFALPVRRREYFPNNRVLYLCYQRPSNGRTHYNCQDADWYGWIVRRVFTVEEWVAGHYSAHYRFALALKNKLENSGGLRYPEGVSNA